MGEGRSACVSRTAMPPRAMPESTLSIREYASTSAQRIGRAANGMVLEVLEYSDGWAKVRWQGQVGFASRAYLQRPAYTAVAQEDVAVYAQPSFGAAAIGRGDAGGGR